MHAIHILWTFSSVYFICCYNQACSYTVKTWAHMDTLIEYYKTTAFSCYLSNLEATDLCLGQCWSPGNLHLDAWAHTSALHWHRGLHHRLLPVAQTCLEADSPEPRCCRCSKCTRNTPKHPTLYITQRHVNLLHSVKMFFQHVWEELRRKSLLLLILTKKSSFQGEEGKRRMKTLHLKNEETWLCVHL